MISANNFVPVNWATAVDLATGRPAITANAFYDDGPFVATPTGLRRAQLVAVVVQPAHRASSTSRRRRRPALRRRSRIGSSSRAATTSARTGGRKRGARREERCRPRSSYVLAWDPVENKERFRDRFGRGGGVLATAGDLVFQSRGLIDGELVAFDATTGQQVWSYPMPNARGRGADLVLPSTASNTSRSTPARARRQPRATTSRRASRQPGRLVAFKLGRHGHAAAAARPLRRRTRRSKSFDDDVVRAGELLYSDHCSRCHGNATRTST